MLLSVRKNFQSKTSLGHKEGLKKKKNRKAVYPFEEEGHQGNNGARIGARIGECLVHL